MEEARDRHLLLVRSEASVMLGFVARKMFNFTPLLHRLALPNGQYRYARPYIESFTAYEETRPTKSFRTTLRDFAYTPAAHEVIMQTEATFNSALDNYSDEMGDAGRFIAAEAAADILRVTESTLTRWDDEGKIMLIPGAYRTFLGVTALRAVVDWQRPEDFIS